MTKTDIEIEREMNTWAETYQNGKFARWKGSPTLKSLYVKHNQPRKVADCVVDSPAKLTLLITNKYPQKDGRICNKCKRTKCDKEKCDLEDYIDIPNRYTYKGGDETGEMFLQVAMFDHDKVPELEEEEIYQIEGTVQEYQGKVSFQIKTAKLETELPKSESTSSATIPTIQTEYPDKASSKALKECKDVLKLFDGQVPESKWNQYTGTLEITDLKKAMTELGVVLKDGNYCIGD